MSADTAQEPVYSSFNGALILLSAYLVMKYSEVAFSPCRPTLPHDGGGTTSDVVRFDCFEINLAAVHLRRRGIRVRLCYQAFQVLALLRQRSGQVVTCDELRRRLWPPEVFSDFG